MYMCVKGNHFFSISTIFSLNFETGIFFKILFQLNYKSDIEILLEVALNTITLTLEI